MKRQDYDGLQSTEQEDLDGGGVDDDRMLTEDGYTSMSPEFDELAMLEALEEPPPTEAQAKLAPQEAYDAMKFQEPLSEDEMDVLDETPFLEPRGGLSFIDDPDHSEWMLQQSRNRNQAMDKVLEDQMYGEEEAMDLAGTEVLDSSGFSIRKGFKKVGRGIKRGARGVGRGVKTGLKAVASVMTYPQRRLIKKFKRKIGRRRALHLARQRGRANKPTPQDVAEAKRWSNQWLVKRGGKFGKVLSKLSGDTFVDGDFVGIEPLTAGLLGLSIPMLYMLLNKLTAKAGREGAPRDMGAPQGAGAPAQGEGAGPAQEAEQSEEAPEEQAEEQQPETDESEGDFIGKLYTSIKDPLADMDGEDEDEYGFVLGMTEEERMDRSGSETDYDFVLGEEFVDGDEQFIVGDEQFIAGDANLSILGEDSTLGDFATDLLGLEPTPAQRAHGMESIRKIGRAMDAQKPSKKVDVRLVSRWAKLTAQFNSPKSANKPKRTRKFWFKYMSDKLKAQGIRLYSNRGLVKTGGADDALGQWLYKLDPRYWVKSTREKNLITAEKKAWQQNYEAQKRIKDQSSELEAGKRAIHATRTARKTSAEAQDVEAQLKDIEQSIQGDFVGQDPDDVMTPQFMAVKAGRRDARKISVVTSALADKLEAGEQLTAQELGQLRGCIKHCQSLKNVTAQLQGYHEGQPVKSDFLGSLDEMTEIVGSLDETTEILGDNPTEILGAAFIGAAKKLSPIEKKQLAHIIKLAKRGVPQARYALAQLKKSGISGDFVGLSLSKALKIATAPVWAPIKYGAKAVKWTGKKIFGKKKLKGEKARAARIKAARAKRIAMLKRREAALATTASARREAEIVASAADAEAAAQTAEAEAQDSEASAREAQYTEDEPEGGEGEGAPAEGEGDSSEGDFVGKDMKVRIHTARIENPKHRQIVKAAASNTPVGKKIRAGAAVYKAAKKGSPKARMAIAKIQKKAKAGDPQAKRDLNAVKAGKIALQATGKAKFTVEQQQRIEARRESWKRAFGRFETASADKLSRMSRKRQLSRLAKVERKAAKGDKKSRAAIAACVERASKGDKKAKANVQGLKLARRVRKAGNTPAERKRLAEAGKHVRAAREGNRKAIQDIKVVQAAAKTGQPNAVRAEERLKIAAAVEKTVATGKVEVPPTKPGPAAQKKALETKLAQTKKKVDAGTATREEALGGAKAARKLGLNEAAGELAMEARKLRSATDGLKGAGNVAAAAQAGDPVAKKLVEKTLKSAEAGNPAGLNSAGNLAGVQAIDAMNKGLPMPTPIAEGVGLIERSRAGDPEAKRVVNRVTEAATQPNPSPKAVEASIAIAAASTILAATAAKPTAQAQIKQAATEARGQKIETGEHGKVKAEFDELYAKVKDGSASQKEAFKAREHAQALGKPNLAAVISATMPSLDQGWDPRSSLPDRPLDAITTPGGLLKESLKALFLATRDPLQNWREGVQSRGATPMAFLPQAKPRTRTGNEAENAIPDGSHLSRVQVKQLEKKATEQVKRAHPTLPPAAHREAVLKRVTGFLEKKRITWNGKDGRTRRVEDGLIVVIDPKNPKAASQPEWQ